MSLSILEQAGLNQSVIAEIEHLVVGCGGFVAELIAHTAGASTTKGNARERLSAADCMVDRILCRYLCDLVPGSFGYSEEGAHFGAAVSGSHPPGLHVRWLVDPVDGTRPATLGGGFGVSVGALVLDGEEPLAAAGWMHLPRQGTLYHGILTPDFHLCRRNGQPAAAIQDLTAADLPQRYFIVDSNWQRVQRRAFPMKLSALGCITAHMAQLVHPEADVAAVLTTYCKPHDLAAALPIVVAGGCEIYELDDRWRIPAHPTPALRFLASQFRQPEQHCPQLLACPPSVAAALRELE